MDRILLPRRLHTVDVIRQTGFTFSGDPTYGPPTSLKAYKHGKIQTVTSFSGKEVISHEQLICDGLLKFSEGDLVVTVDGKKPVQAYAPFDGLAAGTGTTVIYL